MSTRGKRRVVRYRRDLGPGARMRHTHETVGGIVVSFSVQLEVRHGGKWYPVVRHDGAHGFPHRDDFRLDGQTRKVAILKTFAEALTAADRDIKEHWETYGLRFLGGEWP